MIVLVAAIAAIAATVGAAVATAVARSRQPEDKPGDLALSPLLLRNYIAEHEYTEAALRASEERNASLIARAHYGIFRSTPEGRLLEANPAMVRMLGFESAEALLSTDMKQLYVDPAEREKMVERAQRGEPRPESILLRWVRRDRRPITVRASAQTRYRADGTIEYFEVIVEDITEQLRQEEALRRRERMATLGTTLAGVAHELNNPLTAVIGFAQLLLKTPRSPDDGNGLETIHREARRAAHIVRGLLSFTHRQHETRVEAIDINSVVEYILSTRRYSLETQGVHCVLHLDPSIPQVSGDRSQMEQVLLNLLVNAEHALINVVDAPDRAGGSPRGAIEISTALEGEQVVVQLSDTGCGMTSETLAQIWDPFWTTKPDGEGTGLGLAVVHGIVTAHGGTIAVTSEPGVGTAFTIRLPRSDPAAQVVMPTSQGMAVTDSAERALDILVIDDEASITAVLSQYLGSRGHAVLAAHSGIEALSLARQSAFDVVICDLRMPGMDGIETMRALRALPDGGRSRYIVSSAAALSAAVRSAIEALPVDAIVPKPYDIEQLRRAVETQ